MTTRRFVRLALAAPLFVLSAAAQPGVTIVHPDRATCNAAVPGSNAVEGFEGPDTPAAGNDKTFPSPLDASTVNNAYRRGDIQPGLTLEAVGPGSASSNALYAAGAGFSGIQNPTVAAGANLLSDDTQLSFTPGVTTVCIDYYAASPGGFTQVQAFDASGNILNTSNQPSSTSVQSYGITSPTVAIDRVVLSAGNTNAVVVDNVAFGGTIPASAADVTLSAAPSTVAEDGGPTVGTATLTATLDAAQASDVTVTLAFSGGTPGTDFTVEDDDPNTAGVQIVIPANSSTGSVDLEAVDDTDNEDDLEVEVTIDSITGPGQDSAPAESVTITIEDDDPATVTAVTADPTAVLEDGATSTTVTVSLDSDARGDVTVTLTPSGDATAGTDYTVTGDADANAPGVQVVIADGGDEGTFTVAAVDDGTDEPDEDVTFTVSAVSGDGAFDAGNAPAATVDVLDDDAALLTLTISDLEVAEDDGIGTPGEATITATLSTPADGDVTVTLATDDGDDGFDDVVIEDDFDGTPNQITIRDGQTTGTATLTAIDDTQSETDEDVTVEVASIAGDSGDGDGVEEAGGDQSVTVTVTDDADVNVSFAVVQQAVLEDAGSVGLVVEFTDRPDEPFVLEVALVSGDPDDLGGFTSETFVFGGDGDESEDGRFVVTVPVTDDARPEDTETFVFTLTVTPVGEDGNQTATVEGQSSTALVVVDNDGEAVTVTVPAGGPTAFAVPIGGLRASDLADAAGADSVFVLEGARLVPIEDDTFLMAGQVVVVDADADLILTGSASTGGVSVQTEVVADGARVLVAVGNPSGEGATFDGLEVDGGTLSDVVLVFDAESGAFRPISLAGLGENTADLVLGAFGAAVLQVTPDGDPADVSATLTGAGSDGGTDIGEVAFMPTDGETAIVLVLRPSATGGAALVADEPGDTFVLRLGIGDDGLDSFDGADVVSPLGGTLAAVGVTGDDALWSALSVGDVMRGSPVTVPLAVSVPEAGSYEIALESMPGTIGNRPVIVEIFDGMTPSVLEDGAPVVFEATADDTAPGAITGRFSVRVSLGVGVATEDAALESASLAVYPNPSASVATVALEVAESVAVRVAVYDALGREVAIAFEGAATGRVEATIDTRRLAPGAYVVRATGDGFVQALPLTVAR